MATDYLIPYLGSKRLIAKKIIAIFPPHEGYIEVFLGSGAVFLNNDKSKWYIVNDINSELVNLFKVVQHQPASRPTY